MSDLKTVISSFDCGGEEVSFFTLEGNIDVRMAPKLKGRFLDLCDEGKYNIILDLKKVEFHDSSGLGVMIGGLKRVKKHKGMVGILDAQENSLSIFRITGLINIFPFYKTVSGVAGEYVSSEKAFINQLADNQKRSLVLECVRKYANANKD